MSDNLTIRRETRADYEKIDAIQYQAFDSREILPKLVHALRALDAKIETISLVAERTSGEPIGHVMMSHAWLDGPTKLIDVLVLSPLGVLPADQRKGVGTALLKAAIEKANKSDAPLLFLEGSPSYYSSRGFETAEALNFRRPSLRIPQKAFQVVRLSGYDPSMVGSFVYRDVHWEHGVGLYP